MTHDLLRNLIEAAHNLGEPGHEAAGCVELERRVDLLQAHGAVERHGAVHSRELGRRDPGEQSCLVPRMERALEDVVGVGSSHAPSRRRAPGFV